MYCLNCHADLPLHSFDPVVSSHVCAECVWGGKDDHLLWLEPDNAVEWWVVAVWANGFKEPERRYGWRVG